MRLIERSDVGQVDLQFMWLPTFLGMDSHLKSSLESELTPKLVGRDLDDATLDWAHEWVVTWICARYPALTGLRHYLDSIKFVGMVAAVPVHVDKYPRHG